MRQFVYIIRCIPILRIQTREVRAANLTRTISRRIKISVKNSETIVHHKSKNIFLFFVGPELEPVLLFLELVYQ